MQNIFISKQENHMETSLFLIITASGLLFSNALLLNLDLRYVICAILGSVSGSIILGYFKPEKNTKEQMVKALMSTISGIVFGALLNRHYNFADWEYHLSSFFISALVSLILLKALVLVLDTDSSLIVRNIFNRFIVMGKPTININTEENPKDSEKSS